ncbi:hypothetical protein ACCS68_29000 [Rhizobium beringeri]|uniref:hypothetical protein n=1 Tax=Rhizobium TaxID=379 RepID=UPI0010313FEF|nr:hypothetical protein [Rhizobium leguminosarum]TAW53286.1 hypothetical protein ELI14_19280 [Rhizobium leguminosarum]
MRTLVIEWESFNGGEVFMAHFPEPFPMPHSEYQAFAAVFSAWERRHWQGFGEVKVDDRRGPADLIHALRRLGYQIVNRGPVPPGVD